MQREAAIRVPLLMAALISPFAPEPPARKKITTFSGFCGFILPVPKTKIQNHFSTQISPETWEKITDGRADFTICSEAIWWKEDHNS